MKLARAAAIVHRALVRTEEPEVDWLALILEEGTAGAMAEAADIERRAALRRRRSNPKRG